MKNILGRYFGPSTLVAAAFVGPGTVTVCTLAGVRSGYMLLWALVFSIMATMVLQEMTGRLGIVTQKGFGEAIREQLGNPFLKILGALLVIGAVVIGNAAYESGNISGAVLGIETVFPPLHITIGAMVIRMWPVVIGAIAFVLLFSGSYKLISGFLIALVSVMSLIFISTSIVIMPDITEILKGLFIPRYTEQNFLTVIALVGTTVVPYNLFLHASAVKNKYSHVSQLSQFRVENAVGILLGGIISICIVITSGSAFAGTDTEIYGAADMALQLEPLLGTWATYVMGFGLFAAGISSALTAPLAAAYATQGVLGWDDNLKSAKFRFVWMFILIIGVVFSSLSINPVQLIEFAQAANGLLLPFISIFLLIVMNKDKVLGLNRNSGIQNLFGFLVVLVALILGFRSLNAVFNFV